MKHSKPASKTSKTFTSSSAPKTPCPVCTYLGCGRIGHLEDDCRKKKWDEENKKGEGGTNRGGGAKIREKAQVTMDTSNTQNVTELVSITNEDFSDYCTVPSKSSVSPSPNPELSATTLTQTSFNPNGEFSSIVLKPDTTIFDSGCTSHIFRDRSVFHTYFADQATNVATANCGMLSTLARGDVEILLCFNVQKKRVVLKSCLHALDAAVNLLSQGRLDEDGFFITTGNSKALLFCLTSNPNGHDVWAEAP